MRMIVVPFGAAGWSIRERFYEELLSRRQGPPFLYDDALILVPTSRLRRAYGRLFLDILERKFGVRSFVQPEIQTLSAFVQRLASRSLGARVIDENSRLVLLEGLVKELAAGHPALGKDSDVLAPSLAAAAADMIEELAASAVPPERLAAVVSDSGIVDRAPVNLLVDVYKRYGTVLTSKGFVDPPGMLHSLHERFDPAWFRDYSLVVIDGIHDAGLAQSLVLRDIASLEQCTLIVDAPSPEAVRRAGASHPLRLLRESLERINAPSPEAAAEPEPGDRFVAEALFSERSFADAAGQAPSLEAFRKDLRLCSTVNIRDEVSFIAREVKASLGRGTPPDSILVAFPSLDEYGPLAEEIFSDYGIPYNRALGRQLSTSPVATAVVSLLQACQEDFSGPSLQRIASSPFLKFAEQPVFAPALDRFLRDRGIAGGRERLLAALKHHPADKRETDVLSGPLTDLFSTLEPFTSLRTAPLALWMDRLAALLAWSGLQTRVTVIKGPLNTNLQAYRKLADTLASLQGSGRLFPEYSYAFSEWLFLLKKTFMHARFQVPPDDEGGVQVLGLEESAGHAWKEIYLGGLVDGSFPQRLPQNIFLPEATLEALGVRTLEQARLAASFQFYRLLQSAPKVVLTRPENIGDKPVVPSPFLEELAPLRIAGLLSEEQGLRFSFSVEDCRSVPELAKALALAGEVKGLSALLDTDLPGMKGIRAAMAYRPPERADLPSPEGQRVFRVTELDKYLHCPYDYLVSNVLGVAPLEEITEDISALDRGSKVHSILRKFYLSWDRPVTAETRQEALLLLRQLADASFDAEANTFRNRREKDLFVTVMAERFLDAEVEYWKQGMRPAYLEQKIEGVAVVLSDGTMAELHAKIDRIDVDQDGNFVIVDYKTGKYPQPKNGIDQEIFQLPLYAVMARSLAGQGPELRRPVGLAYYDLSGKIGRLTRDMVLYDKDALGEQPATKPQSSLKSADEFTKILAASMDKARQAIEGILKGEFPLSPQDGNQCRYCPNEVMCGRKGPADE